MDCYQDRVHPMLPWLAEWAFDHFWTLFGFFELVWVVVLAVGIVLERRSPVATLAWIAVLAWLPAVGVVIYYFFGPRRLRRKKLRRREATRLLQQSMAALVEHDNDDSGQAQLARLAVGAGEAPPFSVESLSLILEGDDCYKRMCALISQAQHHIHLEYYIFDADPIGIRIRDLLVERAKAGITVRVLLDALGSISMRNSFFDPLREAGGKVAWFNPARAGVFAPQLGNFRTHRKILVVDGDQGMVGGMNVSRCQAAEFDGPLAWRDTHLALSGTAVRSLQKVFLEDWFFASGEVTDGDKRYIAPITKGAGPIVQIVASGPDHDLFGIYKMLFASIAGARERIWITTPYFVPDDPILMALITAALRNVDVRILIPNKSDNPVVDFAARSYFGELLRAGVKVFTYQPRMLHAKTLVVDSDIAIVGTANMDTRSFKLNFEVVAVAYDSRINGELASAFLADVDQALAVTSRDVKAERLPAQIAESLSRLFAPIL